MNLYKLIQQSMLTEVREIKFKLEKDIQNLTENNLETIFNLKFVKSEFIIQNFRIDTLAYDFENKSFVILEYKKDKSFSVIDQGYAYLSLMLNNKSDLILEYNETLKTNLKRNDVDWSQSRVIFVSPSFTNYQKESINFKDLPIELWEVHLFQDDIVSFIPHQPSGATETIKTISKKSETIEKVSKEVKVYTESDHTEKASEEIAELYLKFKSSILNIGDAVSVKPTKMYISFALNKKPICDFHLYKGYLKIWINLRKGELQDVKRIAKDVKDIKEKFNIDTEEIICSLITEELEKDM